jgi:hypothetical protein
MSLIDSARFDVRGRLIWLAALVVWNALFILPMLGPVMHESDQAALIEGALRIAQKGEIVGVAHYNYDKQYGTYWILAGTYRLLGIRDASGILWTANILSLLAVNAALWVIGRQAVEPAARLALLAGLFSPALIVHAPYIAGNYFAALFLALQTACLAGKTRPVLAGVCAFAAIACRADAILVQPLLIWTFQEEPKIAAFWRNRALWWCVAGTLVAIVVGKFLLPTDTQGMGGWNPSFKPKILLGYSVFGLGGFLLVLLFLFLLLLRCSWRARPFGRLYALFGATALLLPYLYYALHLFSTRYWTVPIFATMALLASRRGAEIIREAAPHPFGRRLALGLILLTCFFPLFLGIRLPVLHRPALTLTEPTLLPSADGLLPMGAYLARAWGWDRPERLIPDHNEAVWRAALAGDFGPNDGAPVPLASSPLGTIIKLALYLHGRSAIPSSLSHDTIAAPAYADARSFRKAPIEGYASYTPHGLDMKTDVDYGLKRVSPTVQGEAILAVVPVRTELRDETDLLRMEMRGNDYHTFTLTGDASEGRRLNTPIEGRRVVLLSKSPFEILQSGVASQPKEVTLAGGSAKYYLYSTASLSPDALFRGKECTIAVSVLPSYMNVESF